MDGPIYQTNIEGFCDSLKGKKKIPFFFALDVFDTMSSETRKTSFSQLSQLQNAGDQILLLLDTNPCLIEINQQLQDLYPGHAVFPYFPLIDECAKYSVIIVPSKSAPPSICELKEMIREESISLAMKGHVSKTQHILHQLQKTLNLRVIELEEFYVEQVKKDLEQTGYKANVYYHASFETGKLPQVVSCDFEQDLLYKSVSETATIRQWSVTDQNLVNWLGKKGLALPKEILQEAFLSNLRDKGHKIFGAEFLVIEATKLN